MTCSNCGATQAEGTAFCANCGSAMVPSSASAGAPTPPPPPGPGPGSYTPPPPPGDGYPPPPGAGYSPPGAGYAPPGQGFPPPGAGYAPPGQGFPPPGAGYPPPGAFPTGPGQAWQTPGTFGPTGTPLASWGPRALGYLLDLALIIVPFLVVGVGLGRVSVLFLLIGYLYAIVAGIWFSVQVGSSGASPGMRVMGLSCISTKTGQPIGGGMGFVRSLCHGLLSICFIGTIVDLLFPLWDNQKQTIADKMVSTVVVTAPKKPFSITP